MALESYEACNDNKHLRLINQLPDEIVSSSILSRLTMKEVARTRLVSHYWNRSWYHLTCLNFERPMAMKRIDKAYNYYIPYMREKESLYWQRRSFVNWVDDTLEDHLGSYIDEFVVTFGLDNNYQSHVDDWIVWAFSKHVKILNLNFNPASSQRERNSENIRYVLHETLLEKYYCTMKVRHTLTSLCLTNINVSTEALKKILESCSSTLENLSIERSETLKSITTPLQSLKYLKVYHCKYMKSINICAPKLLSLEYEEGPYCIKYKDLGLREIHIESASSLSRVSIKVGSEDRLIKVFGCLSSYFSQLEYLKFQWNSDINVGIRENHPILANLKHLELGNISEEGDGPFGWIPLIVACPTLEKLTLQLHCREREWVEVKIAEREKQPLRCLKTFEIVNFSECYLVFDIVNFVLENSVVLKEVIFRRRSGCLPILPCGISGLKVPFGVKVICI